MREFQIHRLNKAPKALRSPLSLGDEKAVLDLLSDGVFVVESKLPHEFNASEFTIHYINKALADLTNKNIEDMDHAPLDAIFPKFYYSVLHDALAQVCALQRRQDLEFSYKSGESQQQLRVSLMPRALPSSTNIDQIQIIGCINNVTPLEARANYLEERAVKLIDHANGLDETRRDLEKQIHGLRRSLKQLERTTRYDRVSGLSNRAYFLEQAAAEFQRSKRYGHTMSVAVVELQGIEKIVKAHGMNSTDIAFTGLSQICETACRSGVDNAGRINQSEIAILLPETNLPGALQFVDRLQALVAEAPIQLDKGFVRLGIRTSVDTVQIDDHAFMQSLIRAQSALSK